VFRKAVRLRGHNDAPLRTFKASRKHGHGLFNQQPGGRFAIRREAKFAVFDYLETFYNPRRRHSALGWLSAVEFETQNKIVAV
jgi:transposase InsO family protein